MVHEVHERHPGSDSDRVDGGGADRVGWLGPLDQDGIPAAAAGVHRLAGGRGKSSRCELDLVFYMEMRSGRMRTLHYDFKSGAATPQQRMACFKTIMQENSKSAATSK